MISTGINIPVKIITVLSFGSVVLLIIFCRKLLMLFQETRDSAPKWVACVRVGKAPFKMTLHSRISEYDVDSKHDITI